MIRITADTGASYAKMFGAAERGYEREYERLTMVARGALIEVLNEIESEQQQRLWEREEVEVVTPTGIQRKVLRGGSAGRFESGQMASDIGASIGVQGLSKLSGAQWEGFAGWDRGSYEDYYEKQEEGFINEKGAQVAGAYSLATATQRIWGGPGQAFSMGSDGRRGIEPDMGGVADGIFQQAISAFENGASS